MGLFEDVVVNAKSAANVVGKKAGQLVDISKLKISAADVNREISRRREAMGRTAYDADKAGYDAKELIRESISCIDELYEQLDVINEELAQARNQINCPVCGHANSIESCYCNRCGSKLTKDPEPEKPVAPEAPVSPEEPTCTDEPEQPKDE